MAYCSNTVAFGLLDVLEPERFFGQRRGGNEVMRLGWQVSQQKVRPYPSLSKKECNPIHGLTNRDIKCGVASLVSLRLVNGFENPHSSPLAVVYQQAPRENLKKKKVQAEISKNSLIEYIRLSFCSLLGGPPPRKFPKYLIPTGSLQKREFLFVPPFLSSRIRPPSNKASRSVLSGMCCTGWSVK